MHVLESVELRVTVNATRCMSVKACSDRRCNMCDYDDDDDIVTVQSTSRCAMMPLNDGPHWATPQSGSLGKQRRVGLVAPPGECRGDDVMLHTCLLLYRHRRHHRHHHNHYHHRP